MRQVQIDTGPFTAARVELWQDGRLLGTLPKANIDAAVRTAWLYAKPGPVRAVIVAPRTELERAS